MLPVELPVSGRAPRVRLAGQAGVASGHQCGLLAYAKVVMLAELRRTEVGLAELKTSLRDTPGLRFLPLDLDPLEVFASLRNLRDPFDPALPHCARLHS